MNLVFGQGSGALVLKSLWNRRIASAATFGWRQTTSAIAAFINAAETLGLSVPRTQLAANPAAAEKTPVWSENDVLQAVTSGLGCHTSICAWEVFDLNFNIKFL